MNRFIICAAVLSLAVFGVNGGSQAGGGGNGTPETSGGVRKYQLKDLRLILTKKSRHEVGLATPFWTGVRANVHAFGVLNHGTITGNPATDARQDRLYVDGFNRVNSIFNPDVALSGPFDSFPRTTYFGFSDNSQFSPTTGPTIDNLGSLSLHAFESLSGGYGNLGSNEIRPAVEIFYRYNLLPRERWSLDLEVGLSWMTMGWTEGGVVSGEARLIEDKFTTGTVDPRVNVEAGGSLPYSGPFDPQGGEPWIGSTPTRRVYSSNAIISGKRDLDMEALLLRLGPALSWKLIPRIDVGLQLGVVLGRVGTSFSYADQITFQDRSIPSIGQSGNVSQDTWVFGLYSAVRLTYHLSEKWDLFVEGRHMFVDAIRLREPQRSTEVDLSQGIGVVIGIGYNF